MDNAKISDKKQKLLKIAGVVLLVAFIVMAIAFEYVIKPNNIYNEATALLATGESEAAYEKFYSLKDFKDAQEICNEIKYNEAVELKNSGKIQEAYNTFLSISTYKDSQEICNKILYNEAEKYLKKGYIGIAYNFFCNLSGYSSAEEKSSELLKDYPYLTLINCAPGDEFILGKYEQDNIPENGTEDIEWIVLNNTDGVLYAVSKYILDTKQYNTHNGEGSTLKAWLKDDFRSIAFSDVPEKLISKIGLLSEEDMNSYSLTASSKPEWTIYAKAQNPDKHFGHGYSWWLDGEYFHGYAYVDIMMCVVTESGSYSKNVTDIKSANGVRPAIIIDYTSTDKDYYEADYDDINNAGITTKTEDDLEYIGGSSKCSSCNGTGKNVVKWYSEGDWGEVSYSSYDCSACGGDGRR